MTKTRTGHRVLVFAGFLAAIVASSLVIQADDAKAPWDAPARAARKKNPVPADDKSIAAGKAVYAAQCIKCHGDAGKGNGPSAKELDPKPKDLSDPKVSGQSDGALFWKITTGLKPMPGFETLVSEDDRWNVINYVRKLAPQPAAH